MANFPTSVEDAISLPNPSANDKTNSPSHSTLHTAENAAIIAVETKLGTGASTPTANKVLRATGTGTTAYGQVDVTTDVASFSSANLRTLLSDETGTGSAVFATSPTITTPTLTTPVIASFASATHDHTNAAGGGALGTSSVTTTSLDATVKSGWLPITGTVGTPTYLGNRSYSIPTNSDNSGTVSPGMRLRTTRTVAAPTQCTSLNGTTQYYSKTSPAGMTFTDDFVVSAWVKLSSYAAGSTTIVSRLNGTQGWILNVQPGGLIRLAGFNAALANSSYIQSYQSLPLNKWVHVTAQLDMSSFTATSTTSYIMLDGVDVPASVTRTGTNPTALVQAGNLEVGSYNSGTDPFNGKIAQVAVFNAKVTQATMRGYISQGLAGTETSLISAYSFNNAITDLNTTNANNLTANGSAVATNADSPFGGQAGSTISSTLDYGIVQTINSTTIVCQVPEGCTIPTSGGISSASYGTKTPYGFPGQKGKWQLSTKFKILTSTGTATQNTWYNTNAKLNAPIGSWSIGYQGVIGGYKAASTSISVSGTLSTSTTTESSSYWTKTVGQDGGSATMAIHGCVNANGCVDLSVATDYNYLLRTITSGGMSDMNVLAASHGDLDIIADNAYL